MWSIGRSLMGYAVRYLVNVVTNRDCTVIIITRVSHPAQGRLPCSKGVVARHKWKKKGNTKKNKGLNSGGERKRSGAKLT